MSAKVKSFNWSGVNLGASDALAVSGGGEDEYEPQQIIRAALDSVTTKLGDAERSIEHVIVNIPYSRSTSSPVYKDVYRIWFKPIFDRILAALLLMFLLPVLAIITGCIVVFGGPGNPIFQHRRIGKDGRPFSCLKFRTMYMNADAVLKDRLSRDPDALAEWTATQKLRDDSRVYRFGRILRVTSLDELPQLWNVMRGDMALVGPRPVTQDEMQRWYEPHGAAHAYRSVHPGITGLWQVSGRNDTTYNERMVLDCRYVQTLSLQQDVLILCRTVTAVMRGVGAR